MFKKKKEELDYENLNEAILIGKKILKILLVLLILSIIIIAIFLCQQIQIFKIIGNVNEYVAILYTALCLNLNPAILVTI